MSLNDLINNIDSNTLVLFDINETLVTYTEPNRILRQTNCHNLVKLKSIVKQERQDFSKVFDYMFSTGGEQLILTDNNFPNMIYNIIAKGALCFAMTAIRTGQASETCDVVVEERWSNICKNLGIKFDNSYDTTFSGLHEGDEGTEELKILKLDPFYKNNGAKIYDGIIYCNNIDKGHILERFMQYIKLSFGEKYSKINKIIMVDDLIKNLDAMRLATEKLNENIEFIGCHYTKVEEDEKLLSPIDDNHIRNYIDNLYSNYRE
jgi:hypothetical protein